MLKQDSGAFSSDIPEISKDLGDVFLKTDPLPKKHVRLEVKNRECI